MVEKRRHARVVPAVRITFGGRPPIEEISAVCASIASSRCSLKLLAEVPAQRGRPPQAPAHVIQIAFNPFHDPFPS